jgi:hypothetical protein
MSAVLISLCFMGGIAKAASMAGMAVAPSAADWVDDELESLPKQFIWVPFFVVFLGAAYMLSMATGIRMVLFPPLVVIAFEMFAHADVCPWAQRPILLPAVCTLAAAVGVAALATFGPGVTSTVLAMLFGVVMLRVTRLHAIRALAIALLPQVAIRADWHFPLAVGIGSTLLTASFLLFKKLSGDPAHFPAITAAFISRKPSHEEIGGA